MSCENGACEHIWHYESPRVLAGALQHGLGRGAHEAVGDSAAPDLVMDCVRRDYRWDWLVDERQVYLARLVRDLRLPISPIVAQLSSAPWEEFDEANAFAVALDVLEALARSGSDEAVDAVRGHVAEGGGWLCALETVAQSWPVEWWDDLLSVARSRLGATSGERPHWLSLPLTRWADRDERIAAEVRAFANRPQAPRPFADTAATANSSPGWSGSADPRRPRSCRACAGSGRARTPTNAPPTSAHSSAWTRPACHGSFSKGCGTAKPTSGAWRPNACPWLTAPENGSFTCATTRSRRRRSGPSRRHA